MSIVPFPKLDMQVYAGSHLLLQFNCTDTEMLCCRSVSLEVSADDEISEPSLSEGEGCCGCRRCGRGVLVTPSEGAEKWSWYFSSPPLCHVLPPLFLSQAILRSAPLLSPPVSHSYLCKDRWGAEEMKVFSNTVSLLAQISKRTI